MSEPWSEEKERQARSLLMFKNFVMTKEEWQRVFDTLDQARAEKREYEAEHEKCVTENAAAFEQSLEQALDRAENAEALVARLREVLEIIRDTEREMTNPCYQDLIAEALATPGAAGGGGNEA